MTTRSLLGILLLVSYGSICPSPLFAAASNEKAPPHSCHSHDTESCASSDAPKFNPGDIIELYNVESTDIQIVFPSIVNQRVISPDAETTYHITKTTDGRVVNAIPEKHLHPYVPYDIGSDALCTIGEFHPPNQPASVRARPLVFPCTVLGYEPAATEGAMVLQGEYTVRVKDTRKNEEYVTRVPVWKMQRRYLAKRVT